MPKTSFRLAAITFSAACAQCAPVSQLSFVGHGRHGLVRKRWPPSPALEFAIVLAHPIGQACAGQAAGPVVVGASRQRAAPRNRLHCRAAHGAPASLRRRHAGGAVGNRHCILRRLLATQCIARPSCCSSTIRCSRQRPPRPNLSFNRTRHGIPAWPPAAQAYHASVGQPGMPRRAG
jgi:hypothetical protein